MDSFGREAFEIGRIGEGRPSIYDPAPHFGSDLVDYWLAEPSSLFKNGAGTSAVGADGDSVGSWKGKVRGTLLAASADTSLPTYAAASVGGHGGVAFTKTHKGLRAALSYSFKRGATLIVVGKFTDQSTGFRTLASAGPDTSTNPSGSTDGIMINVASDATLVQASHASVTLNSAAVANNTPVVLVASWRQDLSPDVDLPGITTNAGVQKLWVNGGAPANKGASSAQTYADQTSIDIGYVSLGSRVDTPDVGIGFTMSAAFLVDGAATPATLEAITEWANLTHGADTFSVTAFSRPYEACPLKGFGLGVPGLLKLPLADLEAMGVQWLRIYVGGASQAAVTALAEYYAGYEIDWLLPVTPVSAGAYTNPSDQATIVIAGAQAAGIARPIVELGNEPILGHVPPNSSDFADEATAEAAYATLLTAFMTDLAGQDCIVVGGNDSETNTYQCYVVALAAGASMPNVWSFHKYDSTAVNHPGTLDLLSDLLEAVVIETEMGSTTVAESDNVAWFTDVFPLIESRAMAYYVSNTASAWDATSNSYPLYTTESSADSNGIRTVSGRTDTFTQFASAAGWSLPAE